ncbi:bifunctional [glutamate--ammonia ligase]-adenylyl-L-tyrosine phosphorylase/[glutamate--ammonia-ligase] adenylyltransferase [uncultured Desulfosarcina sp.]|uniref:bifunctional [glutamate--ammonia ligase]-adenylyl-L-tyrosine phosphorylase/[glutamate--ammonia-ligase] adenylyltransferase n=1 Tax=uncultured Desulfosarcina sp. TaxID=218289 RepID=UPI0029C91979|nr:bifunctional [glutamate--ammonia ligase]-adenylyl-L-tyrosine phosphorylase/[glutamate--ammonia-ligase] adenylyltransferase [uncultured Desulfosarcina sp.]
MNGSHDILTEKQQDQWTVFCHKVQAMGNPFDPESEGARLLNAAFAFSDFVAAGCIHHPDTALDLIDSGDLLAPYDDDRMAVTLNSRLRTIAETGPDNTIHALLATLKPALRTFRRREMVRIAVRDLTGLSDLDETMADLSALARAAIDGALDLLYAVHCAEEGVPQNSQGARQRLVVLGMGKLGAGELNFSSDVDLIFTFPSGGQTEGGKAPVANEAFFTRLCRHLIQAIGETTTDGFVFRVDTRLRPYGDGGPLAMSFDHMEDYYQHQGREWERYALIKADVVAGDRKAGRELLRRLRPFVYRRYLDFGVFESLREMKRKISAEVRRKNLHDNIKLGSGGIREIEFFGQMFQLIRGGVLPALQKPAIQSVLETLGREGFIPPAVCRELTAAYRFLRTTEHRLQEVDDRQTHALPADPVARLRLARSMECDSWESFREILDGHRRKVRIHFDGLLETDSGSTGSGGREASGLVEAWSVAESTDERRRLLETAGFPDGGAAAGLLEAFDAEPATRSLSSAGKQRLEKLIPRLLKAASGCDDPATVLKRVLQLLKCIQQRTSYLSLLIEYPTALTHLIRLVGASPWIAAFLSQHPVLLDELLDPRTLYAPPGPETLRAELERKLAAVPDDDLEYQIEALCIFRQVNTLKVAASDITSTLPLMKVSDHLSWIAETILDKVVEISWNHLVEKHGRPTCTLDGRVCDRGFAVIGYGKLGGLELGYGSDLDLVFLHAADPGETVGGPRPIDNAHFFARLGQRVVHMLSTHTPAGMLYEVDMRLRPSGASGLLVSQIKGFADYQSNDAWTWEHQALIRARPITGDAALREAFSAIRRQSLCRRRDPATLKTDVREMRERMRESRLDAQPGQIDIKEEAGAMVDIEFLVQYLVLRHAADHPELTRWTDNVRLLQSLAETGILDQTAAYRLRQAYLIYRAVAHRLNLQERSTCIDSNRFEHLRQMVQQFWHKTLAATPEQPSDDTP